MAINFLNNGYFAGKVGIGVEIPLTTLHLYDTGGSILRLASDAHTDNNKIEFDALNNGTIYHSIVSNTNSGNLQIRAGDNGSGHEVNIYTDGLFAATFDHNQRLGVGTASPNHKLDIYSNENVPLRIHRPNNANLDSDGAWGIGFSTRGDEVTSTTDTRSGIFSYYNGNLFLATNNTRIDQDPFDYARLTILSGGNVGIGTTSPGQKLDVSGNIASNSIYLYDSTSNDRLVLDLDASNNLQIATGTSTGSRGITFFTENSEKMRILSGGNVGIGTANPLSQLSIGSNAITTKKPTVIIADGVAGGSLVIRGLSPILSFDRTGASPENKILMDGVGLEFKTGTLDAEGDVDFKIKLDGKLQAPAYTQGFLQSDANGNIEISGGGTLPGGPYLPLSAGSTKKLTDTLYIQGTNTTNAESVLLRGVSSNDGDFLGSIRTANTGGYNQEMRFYTSNANGTTDEDLNLTLKPDQSATFAGDVTIGNSNSSATTLNLVKSTSGVSEIKFLNVANEKASIQLDAAEDLQIFSNTSQQIKLRSGGADTLTLDSSQNATFAGSITTTSASGIKIDTTGNALLELDGASGSTEAIIFKHSGTEVSRISHSNSTDLVFSTGSSVATALTLSGLNATFAAQAFSAATSSGDASSTLTTKGYVDGLITGATIYRGTWDPDVSLNSGYGNPNLNTVTQTSGYYYICSADGAATPNGTGNEPDSWNTGDWVIWNDDIGTR